MLSLFPRDVLDEIWDLIESVSEGFFYLLFTYLYLYDRKTYFSDRESWPLYRLGIRISKVGKKSLRN